MNDSGPPWLVDRSRAISSATIDKISFGIGKCLNTSTAASDTFYLQGVTKLMAHYQEE